MEEGGFFDAYQDIFASDNAVATVDAVGGVPLFEVDIHGAGVDAFTAPNTVHVAIKLVGGGHGVWCLQDEHKFCVRACSFAKSSVGECDGGYHGVDDD